MKDCQLEQLPQAGEKLGVTEHGLIRSARKLRHFAGRLAAIGVPLPVIRRPGAIQLPVIALERAAPAVPTDPAARPIRHPRLQVQPGELVRVRPLDEIRATLDAHGRCGGLAYMPAMDRFCGRSFPVRKRVDRFFDERTRTMLRVRDVVILDNVFCETGLSSDTDYGGCQRTCFLFWKEDWLERAASFETHVNH